MYSRQRISLTLCPNVASTSSPPGVRVYLRPLTRPLLTVNCTSNSDFMVLGLGLGRIPSIHFKNMIFSTWITKSMSSQSPYVSLKWVIKSSRFGVTRSRRGSFGIEKPIDGIQTGN